MSIARTRELLAELPQGLQLVFVAVCIDRILSEAKKILPQDVAESPSLQAGADLLWDFLVGKRDDLSEKIDSIQESVNKLMPESEDEPRPDQIIENAASAVSLGLALITRPQDRAHLGGTVGGIATDNVGLIYEDYERVQAEEVKLHNKLISLLKSSPSKVPNREMFTSIEEYERGPIFEE